MLVIEKEKINEWVEELALKEPVFVPVRRGEESIFEKFGPEKEIDLDYLPTVRSAKEFFLPAREETFIFNKNNGEVKISSKTKPFVVFGLNLRDLEALEQLDEIMARSNPDFFYFGKRNKAVIIGLINNPAKIFPKADLILLRINNEQYEAVPLTKKGQILIKKRFFKKEMALISSGGNKSEETMPQLRQMLLNPELLADAITWSWRQDLAIWDELANLCLGCGICTYVCPLCYCFSNEDEVSLDGKNCSRCRMWDACTLPKFAQISGGFNFHKTIRERYYNWYFHKFVRAYKEYGKSQCVACGRCQKYCPVKIDIEKYLIRIVDNYKKAMGLS